MMRSFLSRRNRVTIKNLLQKGKQFSHLNGEIVLKKDTDFLYFEIRFDGYYHTVVRFWPENHPTCLPTYSVSTIDSGYDCQ